MNRYVPNPLFKFDGEVVEPVAEDIKDVAISSAPVETGHYKETIEHNVEEDGCSVYTTDEAGPYIEYGTVDTPTFAVLRRAAESVVGTSAVRG